MKTITQISILILLNSCTPFSHLSKSTKFVKEDGYLKVYNSDAGIQSLTFGDFEFATDKKQFKKLNKSKPEFHDILFYAKTNDVAYEYYVLYKPIKVEKSDKYLYKDTLIANTRIVIAISKNAPGSDVKFIMDMHTDLK